LFAVSAIQNPQQIARAELRIVRDGVTAREYFPITHKVGEFGTVTVGEPIG
jgi:hypothetical protein